MDHQPRPESPRQRIIRAARKLFDAKGFHATTTAELAAEAAVSIGQIYRLFEGKDDLILALAEENKPRNGISADARWARRMSRRASGSGNPALAGR